MLKHLLQRDGTKQKKQIEDFKKPLGAGKDQSNLSILIVKDMLLTGFDAPIAQVMYLDRKLTDHNLLQAIARVNRTNKNKFSGYIVDYFGLSDYLSEALDMFSSEDVEGALKDLKDEIKAGRFREDLYHRLSALSFHIPSLNDRVEDIEDLATHFLGILFNSYKKEGSDNSPQLEEAALKYLKQHHYRGNVRELKNILLRAMLFRKTQSITEQEIIFACNQEPAIKEPNPQQFIETMLDQFDSGEANFWSDIHQPFKNSLMTRDTAKSLILAAKERYQTNLPGLAVKLRACKDRSHIESEERKKFLSFKNFLYKTVRISTN